MLREQKAQADERKRRLSLAHAIEYQKDLHEAGFWAGDKPLEISGKQEFELKRSEQIHADKLERQRMHAEKRAEMKAERDAKSAEMKALLEGKGRFSIERRLRAFYRVHDPRKLEQGDHLKDMAAAYKDKTEELNERLDAEYGFKLMDVEAQFGTGANATFFTSTKPSKA